MKMKSLWQLTAIGIPLLAGVAFSVGAALDTAAPAQEAASVAPLIAQATAPAPAGDSNADPKKKVEPKKKAAARAPVTPVPAEIATPEEASQHAADPKAPTGALIIKPPLDAPPPSLAPKK